MVYWFNKLNIFNVLIYLEQYLNFGLKENAKYN